MASFFLSIFPFEEECLLFYAYPLTEFGEQLTCFTGLLMEGNYASERIQPRTSSLPVLDDLVSMMRSETLKFKIR